MKTKKKQRAKWFSLVVGGIAFMVLAGTAAEARKYVTDYQANPRGYVVAVNQTSKQTMLMQKFKYTARQERERLIAKHNIKLESLGNKYKFRARTINKEGLIYLEMHLEKQGRILDTVVTPITSTQWPHTPNNQCTPDVGPKICPASAPCQQGGLCHTGVTINGHFTATCRSTVKWYCSPQQETK